MLKFYFVILIMLITNVIYSASVIVSGGSENDIAGRMCRTPSGRLIAVVERNSDWGSGNFFATFSDDDGATWSTLDTVVYQSGNQSTHSVVCANDTIYLFYASDESGSYKIYSIASVDGVIWNSKTLIDLGWASSQSVYDPIVISEDDGPLTMSYISMSNGAYVAHCPADGTWDTNKNQIIAGGYRARICKHPDGTYLAAYHRNISGNYDIHIKTSTDLVNWTSEINITSNGNSHDAYCRVSPTGVYYLYYAKNTSGVYNLCRKTSSNGVNWGFETTITTDVTSNTQPSLFFDTNFLHLMWTHAIDYDTDNDVYYENFALLTGSESLNYPQDIKLNAYSFHDNLVVDLQGSNDDNYKVLISSITGQVLYNEFLNENESSIVIRNIPAGMYIIKAESNGSSKMLKTIVN